MGEFVHHDEVGRGAELTAGGDVRRLEDGQGSGDREDQVQDDDCLDAGEGHILELLPAVRAVDRCGLIQGLVHRCHRADEQDHVLAHVTPDGSRCQGDVVHLGVSQPVREVVQLKAEPLEHGIKNVSSGVEKLENETDCNAADEVREEQEALEQAAALDVSGQHRRKQQRQCQLNEGADQVEQRQSECLEAVIPGEDRDVILQAYELTGSDVSHVVEAELYHPRKGKVRENQKQDQRKCGEDDDA